MATTKITSPDFFNLESLNTALKLPSGTTAQRPTSPSTGEWRYNTTTNLVEFWDGGAWRDLQSENIPPIPSEHFNTVLYTGTGSAQSITGVGFKPDFVWIKDRDTNFSHAVTDSTRGVGNIVKPNNTDAQSTDAQTITSFDADGFSLGTAGGSFNNNGDNYVAWCWKANAGTTSSNTDGTITSTVQANTKAAFSVVSYTGNAVSGATIGHGLGVEPDIVIVKNLNLSTQSWNTYVKNVTTTNAQFLTLNTADANGNTANPRFIPGNFSSSVFSVGNDNSTNGVSGVDTYIAYCFASVAGYSSIGTYTGNGSTNGPIVNTGFEPAFLMIKCYSDSSTSWRIYDNKRNTTNPRNSFLKANADDVEETVANQVNFLTNGFQLIGTNNNINGNGRTQMYIAFASDPSAAPTLADSFANKLWTGNDGTNAISGLGFQPSFVWIKRRVSGSESHALYDMLRGINEQLSSDSTAAQILNTAPNEGFSSFDTDGFTLGNNGGTNRAPNTYVGWSWKANSIPTINTDGTIQSIVSANANAGMSIVKYTGNGVNGSTVGHGLGVAPEMMIIKSLSSVLFWAIYNKYNTGSSGNPATERLKLPTNLASATTTIYWDSTEPGASVFTIGTDTDVNTNNDEFIAYCFTSISGFSKMGSYVGNATNNRAITGLGFQPDFVMLKNTASSTTFWSIFDSSRGGSLALFPNSNQAEANETGVFVSLDSDGFTVNQEATANGNGNTIIYMAFKENPTPYPLAGNMSFLVIAGGASGAVAHGGGGGAGGLRTSYGSTSGGGSSAESDITLAAGTYTITVGAGGGGATSGGSNVSGNNGVDSSISASGLTTITSIGGGGGSSYAGQTTPGNGGSGGGGGNQSQAGGSGTAGQGYNGGTGSSSSSNYPSGGGGGAGAVGGNGSGTSAGNGGAGLEVSITGSSVAYAGGAGGSSYVGGTAGTGGIGGGANGTNSNGVSNAGTANTGGGGSGATGATSGAGGSGVVILRLATSEYSSSTTGSPTVTTDGDYTVLTYTGSGTYVHS